MQAVADMVWYLGLFASQTPAFIQAPRSVGGAFRAQVFHPCFLDGFNVAFTTGSSFFLKQTPRNSLSFAHDKVYITARTYALYLFGYSLYLTICSIQNT